MPATGPAPHVGKLDQATASVTQPAERTQRASDGLPADVFYPAVPSMCPYPHYN